MGVAGHVQSEMSLTVETLLEPMGRPSCPGLGWAKQNWDIGCSESGPKFHFISTFLSKDKEIPGELTAAMFLLSVPKGWHGCLFQDLP